MIQILIFIKKENNYGVILMIKQKNVFYTLSVCAVIFLLMFSVLKYNSSSFGDKLLITNAKGELSNKKICWGIKREPNHKQPDVGTANKSVLDNYNGICMGNSESKKVYLTFDSRI